MNGAAFQIDDPKSESAWKRKRLKHLGKIYPGLAGKAGEDFSRDPIEGFKPFVPFVSVANFKEVPKAYQYVRARESEGQNEVNTGDLLFLMSSETLEDIGKSAIFAHEGETPYLNSFCKGFRPDSDRVFAKFLNYTLMSAEYRRYFANIARGFTRINLKQEYILNAQVCVPPLTEQRAIAAFLDGKCATIDEAVRIKEEQIALLRERRQILIQQAVTRGLNPSAPMKDSGIDWIGQIPAHWEMRHNKFIFSLKKNLVGKRAPDYDLLSLTLRGLIKRDMENPEGKFPAEFDTYQEVSPGYFVFCHFDVEETPRTVGLSRFCGMITGAYTVYEPAKDVNARFLMHFYLFADTDKKMRGLYKGLRNTIPKDSFAAFKTPLPPREEQDAIVAHIDDQSRRIDAAMSIKQDQIAALKEYKTSLINAAVTGKIKVT